MAIETGREAPDVTVRNEEGEPLRLADFRGDRAVLLVFHPFSFTDICESEMSELADDLPRYRGADVELISLSCDAPFVRAAWKRELGHPFTYASDFWPHGDAARAFGIFDETLGCARRATFLIDRDGMVRHAVDNPIAERREQQSYHDAVARL